MSKQRKNNWTSAKLKAFVLQKTPEESGKTTHKMEHNIAKYIYSRLVSRIYKECEQLNNER